MKTRISLFIIIFLNAVACNQYVENHILVLEYPVAPSDPISEMYFGRTVTDDYRNLENLNDSLVRKWFKEEAEYAEKIIENISGRDEIIEKIKKYDQRKSYVVRNVSITEDDQYFF